jgi:hypothetical protein
MSEGLGGIERGVQKIVGDANNRDDHLSASDIGSLFWSIAE